MRRQTDERHHEPLPDDDRHRLFWPVAVLVVLLAANIDLPARLPVRSSSRDGHLYGSLIDILRLSAPLILVALGMTLVIATGGIDLSVGSVVRDQRRAWPACRSASSPTRTASAGC